MATLCAFVALLLCIFLCPCRDLLQGATNASMGISYACEERKIWLFLCYRYSKAKLSTTAEGKLGMFVGLATLAFSHGAPAKPQKRGKGHSCGRVIWFAVCCGWRALQGEANPRCECCSPWCFRFPQFTAT